MARTYNVIDADGHVLEPVDIWEKYIDPAYRDRAPRLIVDTDGKERLLVEGKVLGSKKGFGNIGAIGARQGRADETTMKYMEGRPGGFDPHARIPDMDLDGIDAAFLYPSVGLFAGAVQEPGLAAAMCRAYNRWLADYCRPYPDRLFGVAMLPMQSIDLAIEEMRFARTQLGMRGGFLRPNPYNGRMLHHPDYAPFWREVEELDFAIGLHEGASGGMPQVGVDRFETRGARHIISHTMEMMLAAMSVIWEGVCDRHPRVRIGFMESGGGWIAPWLDRMDRHFDDAGFNDSGLTMRPSELFQRNCWISFEPVEGSLSVLADYIGPHKILWATDYPHPDGFFPGAPKLDRRPPGAVSGDEARDPGRRRQALLPRVREAVAAWLGWGRRAGGHDEEIVELTDQFYVTLEASFARVPGHRSGGRASPGAAADQGSLVEQRLRDRAAPRAALRRRDRRGRARAPGDGSHRGAPQGAGRSLRGSHRGAPQGEGARRLPGTPHPARPAGERSAVALHRQRGEATVLEGRHRPGRLALRVGAGLLLPGHRLQGPVQRYPVARRPAGLRLRRARRRLGPRPSAC